MGAIELLAWLMDEAFEGAGLERSNEAQSLMANLATVTDDQWRARLPGSTRTIESIALHVAGAKRMYANHAFEDARLTYDQLEVTPWGPGTAPRAAALDLLRRQHGRLMVHVRALAEPDLVVPRRANWGELRETRWLLDNLLQHDLYHAGEINHLRGILDGDDRWRWQMVMGIDPRAGDGP
jgi:hypothetical protein